MLSGSIFLFASFLFSSSIAAPTLEQRQDYQEYRPRGKTYLTGNAFGVLNRDETFDYVVVGAGTAGATLASRLAATGVSVAIIEAGGFYDQDNGNASQVPGYSSNYMTFNDLKPQPLLVDWGLITEPQAGLNGRRIHYTAGKTLGGSSALHAVYHRSSKGSFDKWADQVGDDGYKWSKFFAFLKKSIAFSRPNYSKIQAGTKIPYDPSAYSSSGGPLQLSFPNYRQPFDRHMEKAFSKSGFGEIDGFNSGNLYGYGPATFTVDPKDQTRSTSKTSFIQQALDRTNMKIYINTLVNKVLFDGQKKATGVSVQTNGVTYTLSARKEVVVSAGVFHSPQILMLSGIGPQAHLQEHGIPVISNLAGVGQNLEDHVFIFTSHKMNLVTNSAVLRDPVAHAAASQKYINNQDGPLCGVGGEIIGFEKLPNRTSLTQETKDELSKYPKDWPEVEYLGLAFNSGPADEPTANDYIFFAASLQTLNSKGTVELKTSDIKDAPKFNPNILTTTPDLEVAVEAVKRARLLAKNSGQLVKERLPGDNVKTDEELKKFIKDNAVVGDHASSSCAMGKKSNPMAVLDSKGRVYGVQGLRVVDASSFPFLPPGHPLSSVYALAEKIAVDIINGS